MRKNINKIINKLVRPTLRRRGFSGVDIIQEWSYIVGDQWAKQTAPIKISFNANDRQSGVLFISVTPGANVLMSYIEPQIIDRINTYFGFKAVAKLRYIHGYKPEVLKKTKKEKSSAGLVQEIDLQGIEHEDLKTALSCYHKAMFGMEEHAEESKGKK